MSRSSLVGMVVAGAAVVGLAGCVDEPASTAAPAASTPAAATNAGGQPPGPAPAWSEPAAYTFVLNSTCGERELIGRFRIAVAAGRVTRVDALDGPAEQAVQIREGELAPTLAQLMVEVQTARDDGAHLVRTDVDPSDGHPTAVQIDRDADAVDDELCYAISEYKLG